MKKIDTIVVAPHFYTMEGLAWVITVTPPWLWMEARFWRWATGPEF